MKSTVASLEDNRVKLQVEIAEDEFDVAVDDAFKRIAREVRIPGFRPGKAPRKLLESRLGSGVAREEALREALPEYYAEAVREHDVDVIAPPEIDVTDGTETGPVHFDAVVEIRPEVELSGYEALTITVPAPGATDEAIDEQIERLLSSYGTLETVERAVTDGDHATINIAGSQGGEPLDGLTADGYVYQVGSGAIVPELDARLLGAKVGEVLEFDAPYPGSDDDEDDLQFRILVKEVQERVLPEPDDEWAAEASEFETLDELRADIRQRLELNGKVQAQMAVQEQTAQAIAELVELDPPEPLISAEIENRLQDMAMRLQSQGVDPEQYFAQQDREQLLAGLREAASTAVRVDLGLRAVATAESLGASDEDVDAELERIAGQTQQDLDAVRHHFEHHGTLGPIRSDIQKRKALDWVIERASLEDEDGKAVDRTDLEFEAPEGSDDGDADSDSTEPIQSESPEATDTPEETDE